MDVASGELNLQTMKGTIDWPDVIASAHRTGRNRTRTPDIAFRTRLDGENRL